MDLGQRDVVPQARHDVEGEVLIDPVEVAERDRKLAIVHALALVFGAS